MEIFTPVWGNVYMKKKETALSLLIQLHILIVLKASEGNKNFISLEMAMV